MGITGNEKADLSAKNAQKNQQTDIKIPYKDLKQHINDWIKKQWQTSWNNEILNKLQIVKKNIGQTQFTGKISRKEEVILYRLRIGHTHLTHVYLLKRENKPDCDICQVPITVEHVLIHCTKYALQRTTFKDTTSI